ncbi:LAME_0E09802g1_1 [Lachancea meyersii CBS 8951]|uniref:LAME_0E09802g1_1 n=1 Tax=Lachancea meyersii CBS 8951 TaxID=1266667 RepID=A0A1G4JJR8_9SACH|nr:LAME_0E09802g1_1 [Lachancea meyersii CBS 8951]
MVKAVIFTDFDGTVTWQDSNDFLTDIKGFGKEERTKVFEGVLDGTKSFRDGFWAMLESVKTPFPECVKLIEQNIDLDPGFKDTFEWAQENDVPIVVISSGMRPLIKALLTRLVGPEAIEKIDIVSNEVEIDDDEQWRIVYKDDSPFGHDKSKSITEYKKKFEASGEKPTYFYCGDGVSDLSAAKECDLLFAKRGKDLVTYCKRQNVPFHEFDTFEDILASMKDVMASKKTVDELMQN